MRVSSVPPDKKDPIRSHARVESKLYGTESLTADQKHAAESIAGVIASDAARTWMPNVRESFSFGPMFEGERRNRVFLIDGARGSGKTSVLVHLLHRWSAYSALEGKCNIANEGNILAVANLDLHPLPTQTSLLLFIAASFQPVLEWAEQRYSEPLRGGLGGLRAGMHESTAQKAWRTFVDSMARGWDTNLGERKPRIDHATWAFELLAAESSRLKVRVNFVTFLDELVRAVQCSPLYRERYGNLLPYFVVGIDDADMNSEKCVEIVALIRTIAHPRLAFVLTGDTPLFLHTLAAAERRRDTPSELSKSEQERFSARYEQLARDIYDKTIPRGQRFELKRLRLHERVSFLPAVGRNDTSSSRGREQGGTEQATSNAQKIRSFFDQVMVPIGETSAINEIRSLQWFIDRCPQFAESLPDRLREQQDFVDFLDRVTSSVADESQDGLAIKILDYLWQASLESWTFPALDDVRDFLKLNDRHVVFRTSDLTWGVISHGITTVTMNGEPGSLVLRTPSEIFAQYKPPWLESTTETVPRRVASTIMFLIDVVKAHSSWLYDSPNPQFEDQVYVEYHEYTTTGTLSIPWPAPNWRRFGRTLYSALLWREVISVLIQDRRRQEGDNLVSTVAKAYLLTMHYIAKYIDDQHVESSGGSEFGTDLKTGAAGQIVKQATSQGWQSVLAEIHSAQEHQPLQLVYTMRLWLQDEVLLLASPLLGLPHQDANEIFGYFRDKSDDWSAELQRANAKLVKKPYSQVVVPQPRRRLYEWPFAVRPDTSRTPDEDQTWSSLAEVVFASSDLHFAEPRLRIFLDRKIWSEWVKSAKPEEWKEFVSATKRYKSRANAREPFLRGLLQMGDRWTISPLVPLEQTNAVKTYYERLTHQGTKNVASEKLERFPVGICSMTQITGPEIPFDTLAWKNWAELALFFRAFQRGGSSFPQWGGSAWPGALFPLGQRKSKSTKAAQSVGVNSAPDSVGQMGGKWPSPTWPTMSVCNRIVDWWNNEVADLSGATRLGDGSSTFLAVESFFACYVFSCCSVALDCIWVGAGDWSAPLQYEPAEQFPRVGFNPAADIDFTGTLRMLRMLRDYSNNHPDTPFGAMLIKWVEALEKEDDYLQDFDKEFVKKWKKTMKDSMNTPNVYTAAKAARADLGPQK